MNAQQLKNSILQMAVQGKLVPQDPNDEPASVLLERIRAEKEKLIKEGKIKKEKNPSYIFRGEDNLPYEKVGKNEPVCIADEVPFEIPDSWEWVRFKDLVNYSMGKTPPRKESEYWEKPSFPWVSIADMIDGEVINITKEQVNQFSFDNVFKGRISPAGTLLMSFKLTVGKVSVLGMDAFHNEAIISIYPYISDNNITRDFLFETLPLLSMAGDTKTAIKGNTLNSDSLDALFIPLPPINEQLRITRKLQELKKPIADYDVLETTSSKLAEDFPELLKKSILQQAVMGKLIPQDPNDEPASVLLDRIRAEKQAMIKAGKLKKDKHESIIYRRDNSHYEKIDGKETCIDNEIPFEIPDNWEWTRASSLGSMIRGRGIKRTETVDDGFPCLRYGEIYTSYNISFSDAISYIDEQLNRVCLHFNSGDIVFTLTGENKVDIAKAVAYLGNAPIAAGGDLAFWTAHGMDPLYIVFYMACPFCIEQKRRTATGDIIVHISTDKVGHFLVPVPPIVEQKRIVAAILELFNIIATL